MKRSLFIIIVTALISVSLGWFVRDYFPDEEHVIPIDNIEVVEVDGIEGLLLVIYCPERDLFSVEVGGQIFLYRWNNVTQDCESGR